MYKKLVQMIIEAETPDDINEVCGKIGKAFESEKISWKDHEQLFDLVAKIDGSYRKGVKTYKA